MTLRAVAARLDIKAPALYWHIRSKQELLDEMGTEIQRRVQRGLMVNEHGDWRERLVDYARVLRAEYLCHRDGARTFSGTRLTDPEVLRAQEPWFARLTEGGGTLGDIVTAAELVTAFVVGFVIEEQERAQSDAADPSRYALDRRDAAVGDSAPLVRAAGHGRGGSGERFERQLGIVMSGLERMLAEGSG